MESERRISYNRQFDRLRQLYKIEQVDQVIDFLKKHPYFIEILVKTYKHIKKIFNKHFIEAYLEFDSDPEENFEGLTVVVNTSLSSKKSLDLWEKLEKKWWLNVDSEVAIKLGIIVRSTI